MFLLRLLYVFGMFVLVSTSVTLTIMGTIWIINSLVQLLADFLGVEVTDFFDWLRTKLPKRKEKSIKYEERP